MHVWNGQPGKPTVAYFYGSMMCWDGSSNFNFVKELMNRYMGNAPNKVFQKPNLKEESIDRFDGGSFMCFLLQLPFLTFRNWLCFLWHIVRAWKCFGGNGFGPKTIAMNFTEEESNRLYGGAKAQGITPFAAFTYAAVKACDVVLGQKPRGITQQASLQTRHFPLPNQADDMRDLVGDWLFGPVQKVPAKYGPEEAMAGYRELQSELDNLGPIMQQAILAKAYGLMNSGAALFQGLPTYGTWSHCFDRNLFMNNYGVRTMPEGSPFHWWTWNAPLWLGLNTINVDGRTTTLIGSMMWGIDVLERLRDTIEDILRNEFMAKSPASGQKGALVPSYKKKATIDTACTLGASYEMSL
jgi:hypothetical protein